MSKEIIANVLKIYREKNNITVKEISEKFNKSIKTVYSWESGQAQPDADTLIELCKLYGISSFSILLDSSILQEDNLSEFQQVLLNNCDKLNSLGQQVLLEQSKMMTENPTYKKITERSSFQNCFYSL